MRRIEAEVEVNGEWVVMVFLTNNMLWAPSSICDLYRCRWGIEVFFKQIKQTFKACDFLGHSKHAIRWQLWAALLLLVLLRYIAFISQWPHSFTRLFTLVRGVLWDRFGLFDLADFYGAARIRYRMCSQPQQAYLPGFSPWFCGTASSHFNRFPLVLHFDFLPISIANPLHPSGLHYGVRALWDGCVNFSGFRALITGATALISVIALAPSLEASAVLTGLTEFSTDASGNFSGGQLWNTVNGDGANNLYIADGGPAGTFHNSGDGASTAPSMNLQIGTNAFAIFGEPGLAISSYGLTCSSMAATRREYQFSRL